MSSKLAIILNRIDVYSPLEIVPSNGGFEARISWEGGLALKVAPSPQLAIDALVESFPIDQKPSTAGLPPTHPVVIERIGAQFRIHHLPPHLREASRPFRDLAWRLARQAAHRSPDWVLEALRDLWRAKNSAVVAVIQSREDAAEEDGCTTMYITSDVVKQ